MRSVGDEVGWLWGWLVMRLVGYGVGWLWGWLAMRSVGDEVGWLWGWFTMRLVGYEVGWLWGQLAMRLAGYGVGWLWGRLFMRSVVYEDVLSWCSWIDWVAAWFKGWLHCDRQTQKPHWIAELQAETTCQCWWRPLVNALCYLCCHLVNTFTMCRFTPNSLWHFWLILTYTSLCLYSICPLLPPHFYTLLPPHFYSLCLCLV